MAILKGRMVAATGAGFGIGRETAVLCAREGVALVVSDPHASSRREGADARPAVETVVDIEAAGSPTRFSRHARTRYFFSPSLARSGRRTAPKAGPPRPSQAICFRSCATTFTEWSARRTFSPGIPFSDRSRRVARARTEHGSPARFGAYLLGRDFRGLIHDYVELA